MKKLLSLLIALSVLVSSAAIMGCGDTTKKDKDTPKKDTPPVEKKKDAT